MLKFTSLEAKYALPEDKRTAAFNKALQYLDDHHLLATEDEEIEQFKAFYQTRPLYLVRHIAPYRL